MVSLVGGGWWERFNCDEGTLNCPVVSSTEELVSLTSCQIPCLYNTFESVDRKDIVFNNDNNKTGLFFALRFATTKITVREDYEHYPFPSFLAEVGGALGLFLGYSFMTCWDPFYMAILKLGIAFK